MAYQSNKPQGADALSQSQGDILNNFISIKALVDINHETFDIPQKGKHTQVDLTDQTAAPPTSAADEVTLYSNAGDLCLSKNAGAEINFTNATGHAAAGWSRMPSGLLLKWGYNTATGYATFNYPTGAGIPAFTAVYMVLLTPYGTGTGSMNREIRLQSYANPLQFGAVGTRRYQNNDDTCEFTWLAIGV